MDPTQFKGLMANLCSPVTVVTSTTPEGVPYGTTVSAFASLSLHPPMVLVALGNESTLLAHVLSNDRFGVNILAADQDDVATQFAQAQRDKFDGVEWAFDAGLPRLEGIVGWAGCAVENVVTGGDHSIVLGEVVAAEAADDGLPLVYARRQFGTHSVLQQFEPVCARAGGRN